MSGITDSEDQLNVLWRRKEPKTNNANLGIGFAPKNWGVDPGGFTKINYIQKEVNACTQKVLFLELLC